MTTTTATNYANHNYVLVLAWLAEEGKIKPQKMTVNDFEVQHDSNCGLHKGTRCNCRPNILVNGKRLRYPLSLLR